MVFSKYPKKSELFSCGGVKIVEQSVCIIARRNPHIAPGYPSKSGFV
jgi:hypothetical protein